MTTPPQPLLGSLPDTRQTLTATTFAGFVSHSGLSPCVAVFMKAAQIGTASSAA